MHKIMIVDDNPDNRMLLRVMLEEYARETRGCELELAEALNGSEAVGLAASEPFDLIFMDIMMPEMDGIEATRRIRARDGNVMIVAISAVDDAARQKEILQNGAEDYIPKPVNADIFRSRIGNYLALVASRTHPRHYGESINLYTAEVFSRQLVFRVGSEDELAEFWEYYLLGNGHRSESLSDAVRTLYAIGDIALKLGLTVRIVVEESDARFFFTMTEIGGVDAKLIRLTLAKNPTVTDYRLEAGRITFVVPKEAASAPQVSQEPEPAVLSERRTQRLEVFAYMDPEDLAEIRVYVGKLDSLFLLVGRGDLHEDETEEIYTYIDRIGGMMTIYSESYEMGQALKNLAHEIATHGEVFMEKSEHLAPLCSAFSRDLSNWIHLIFEAGAASVHYMDDTIIANARTIGAMLTMGEHPDAGEADLDDIFDF